MIAEEGQTALAMEPGEPIEEQPSELPREHTDRQEEAWPAGDPSLAILRQPAAGDDDVGMRVMGQMLH